MQQRVGNETIQFAVAKRILGKKKIRWVDDAISAQSDRPRSGCRSDEYLGALGAKSENVSEAIAKMFAEPSFWLEVIDEIRRDESAHLDDAPDDRCAATELSRSSQTIAGRFTQGSRLGVKP